MPRSVRTELDSARRLRERNKPHYRLAHWPIWIFVFFIAPGPLVFRIFAHGFNRWTGWWFVAVLATTGIAAFRGSLPGVEPRPYIIRFTEDRPNPAYRRICYTFAWSAVVVYALLNAAGMLDAAITGRWHMKQIYDVGYFPLAAAIWIAGALGRLPRVMSSTKGEGSERRYFYGSVWAVCVAQPIAGLLWRTLPRGRLSAGIMLAVFAGILAGMGVLAARGVLPRTRRIVPGELAISD